MPQVLILLAVFGIVCTVLLVSAVAQVAAVFRVSLPLLKAMMVMLPPAQPVVLVLFKVPVLFVAFGKT